MTREGSSHEDTGMASWLTICARENKIVNAERQHEAMKNAYLSIQLGKIPADSFCTTMINNSFNISRPMYRYHDPTLKNACTQFITNSTLKH
jgi:hypothetical protein